MAGKINLIGKTLEEIKNELENEGLAAYRATQIYQWIYKRQTSDFSRMTNLGLKLREQLAEKYDVSPLKTIKNRKSGDNSEKFLFELKDKEKIETVFLPVTGKRNSICLSTQVGCRFNCGFCATGKQGFTRNLSCGEIINQLLTVQLEKDVKITNVVFMGMGEPLDNYDNLVKTIALLNDGRGLNISCRRMTVSTCGLANKIKKLANSGFPVTLAISLHSGFNSLRDELVPVNKHYPIADLLEAADYYSEKTGRRVSYEYALIKGVNDSKNQARKLADLLAGRLAHVNIITLNPVTESPLESVDEETEKMFEKELQEKGVAVSIRTPRGGDIAAACGQLKTKTGGKDVRKKTDPQT